MRSMGVDDSGAFEAGSAFVPGFKWAASGRGTAPVPFISAE